MKKTITADAIIPHNHESEVCLQQTTLGYRRTSTVAPPYSLLHQPTSSTISFYSEP
jgi:hypothetical protein